MNKYNKLSIVSFALMLCSLFALNVNSLTTLGFLIFVVSLILAVVSYRQIKKTKEKGKGFLIAILTMVIIIVILMVLLYLPVLFK